MNLNQKDGIKISIKINKNIKEINDLVKLSNKEDNRVIEKSLY